ncbi:MAG: LSM domain-containing protein [Candidatus Hydrothermarchaeales archaeon]
MTALRPLDLLHKTLESPVIVGLKNGKEYRGILKGYDIHMNVVLQNAEELENDKPVRTLGKIIIRGDSVVFISP